MQIAVLGKNANLSLAELERLYGGQNITQLNHHAALVDGEIDIAKLGGTVKIAKNKFRAKDLDSAFKKISNNLAKIDHDGKLKIGLSYYGSRSPSNLHRALLDIKKSLRSQGQSVRIINKPKDKVLNAAQVKHNKLTSAGGIEWIVVQTSDNLIIGQTTAVQDIDAFAARDQARPVRDAKIGMLPPKLALMIVNLSVGDQAVGRLLDPFCGTGVTLQEAKLRGFEITGSDINPNMVSASMQNINWLSDNYNVNSAADIYEADAVNGVWDNIDFIAGETYLGPPLAKIADRHFLSVNVPEIDKLHRDFLKNIHGQLKPGATLALALPTWRNMNKSFSRLPLVDHLKDLGYNPLDFKTVNSPLIYWRDGQYVGRDIIVIRRI